MKVKNIMFSGAMASILMMGGAYATGNADGDLATAGFVRGAYKSAVAKAVGNVVAGTAITVTPSINSTDGSLSTVTVAVDDTKFDAAGAATSALSDAKDYADGLDAAMDTRVDALEDTVGNENSGLVKDVKALKAVTGEVTDIAGAIATAVAAEETRAKAVEGANADAIASINNATTGILAQAKAYADTEANAAETAAKNYADTQASAAETAAKTYADTKASAAETAAKTYADGLRDAEVSRANGAYAAKTYETTVANNAEAIATLNGDASTTGSVAKAVADEAERAQGVESGLQNAIALKANSADVYTKTEADDKFETQEAATAALALKQDKLTASTNIQISETGVITATDTTYTAGTGLELDGTVFSLKYGVTGNEFSATE